MPILKKLMDGENGLEGEVSATGEIVLLSKPELHVRAFRGMLDSGVALGRFCGDAETDEINYYLFEESISFGGPSALAYNTFKKRER